MVLGGFLIRFRGVVVGVEGGDVGVCPCHFLMVFVRAARARNARARSASDYSPTQTKRLNYKKQKKRQRMTDRD